MFIFKMKKLYVAMIICCLCIVMAPIVVNAGTENGWLDQEELDMADIDDDGELNQAIAHTDWQFVSKPIYDGGKIYVQAGIIRFDDTSNYNSDGYWYYEVRYDNKSGTLLKSGTLNRSVVGDGLGFVVNNKGYVYKYTGINTDIKNKYMKPFGYYLHTPVEVKGSAPDTPTGTVTRSGKTYTFNVSAEANIGQNIWFDFKINDTVFDTADEGTKSGARDKIDTYKYVINTSSTSPTAATINSSPTGITETGSFTYTADSTLTQYYAHIIAVSYTGKVSGVYTMKLPIATETRIVKVDANGGKMYDTSGALVSSKDKTVTISSKTANQAFATKETDSSSVIGMNAFVTKPVREGYTFKGWAITSPANSGMTINNNATIGASYNGSDGSMTYFYGYSLTGTWCGADASTIVISAIWDVNTATIHYNANGGKVTTDKTYTVSAKGYLLQSDGAEAYKLIKYNDSDPVNVHNIAGSFGVTYKGHHLVEGAEYRVGSATSTTTIDHDSAPLSVFQKHIKDGDATINLFANWAINQSTLTIDPNGGTWGSKTTKQSFTQDYNTTKTIADPTREGYTFDGWEKSSTFTAGDLSGKTFTFGDTNGGTGTLTAKWKANTNTKYVVNHYQMNTDGSTYKLKETENKTGTTASSVTIANLKKTYAGFTYEGGKGTTSASVTKPSSFDTTTTVLADGTRVINVYYSRNQYTITLTKGTGISSVTGAGTYYYGAKVTLGATIKDGYHWSKWTGTYTSTTQTYSFTMPDSDVDMAANAIANKLTMYYNANGGSISSDKASTYYLSSGNIYNKSDSTIFIQSWTYNNAKSNGLGNASSFGLYRTGYTFSGWKVGSNGTTVFDQDDTSLVPTSFTSDIKTGDATVTMYAVWTPNVYKITLDNQSATTSGTSAYYEKYNTGNYTTSSCTTSISKIKIPTKTGYAFGGYYTDTDGNGTQYVDASGNIKSTKTTFTSNTTLYAKWTPNKVTLYYNVNDGIITNTNKGYPIGSDGFMLLKDKTGKAFKEVYWTSSESVNVHNMLDTFGVTKPGYHLVDGKEYKVGSKTSSIVVDHDYEELSFYQDYMKTGDATLDLYANWVANAYSVKYDSNKPSNAIGSVSGTMSNSSHTYDVAKKLTKNDYSLVGYKFLGWNTKADGSGTNYSDKQSVINLTTTNNGVVTLYAQWQHDDSGVGTLTTPSIKVNNPSNEGIYYYDGIYFVKGDGKTTIELHGEATLNPILLSRVDKIALNYVANPLVTNPTYEEKYSLSIPKEDVWNSIYNKDNIVKYNAYSGSFVTYKDPTIVDILQNKLSFTQQFVITGNTLVEPFISSKASCMVKHEDGDDSIHDLYAYGNSVRLQGDAIVPNTYIIDENSNKVSINAYNSIWTNQSKATIVLEDSGSGIKYYKLMSGQTIVKEGTNTSYTTKNSFELSFSEGTTSYSLYIVDNVGNEKTYAFNTNVDRVSPSIEDLIITQGRGNVYTGNNNTDSWPLTSKSTTWEYNWEVLKELKYKAIDDKAGLKLVKITHYGQDGTYTSVWKSVTLVDVSENKLNMEKEKLIEEFNGDAYLVDGKNYLLIEVEDVVGNKTSVKLVVRKDASSSKITNLNVTPVSLDKYTIEELNELFSKGDMSKFKTNVKFSISDNISTSDTSGIKTIEIVVKDSKTGVELKRYDVSSYLGVSSYTLETSKGNSRFSPLIRSLDGTINVNLDTLGEFPKYSELKVYVETTDYIGNKQVVGGNVFTNYSIKTTIYNTKDNAYNVSDASKKTNTPYFKTGEVGFIEVWSVGYVDKLELDFSDGNIGKEMNDAIANRQMDAKYKLGVHGALPSQVRFIKDLSAFKVNTSYPDIDGVSFASHISYTFSEVNNSMGTSGVDGWNEKGTMIRIPTNHELVALNKLDKYGNELYKWETHLARVYPYKEDVQGNPSGSYYTIWDNSSDDLHFRIFHLFFGY